MMWAYEIEQSLDRLRRYAVFACGSASAGDNVVDSLLTSLLTEGMPEGPASAEKLFSRIEAILEKLDTNSNGLMAGFGRWQLLEPMERRLVLLINMEGFSCEAASRITGLPVSQVRARMARAQMRYADRFPARVGLVGVEGSAREKMGLALRKWGHSVLWSVKDGRAAPDQALDVPGLIIAVGTPEEDAPVDIDPRSNYEGCQCLAGLRTSLGSAFFGPVIVARGTTRRGRLDNRVWQVPVADIAEPDQFRRAIASALLFTA
ncbi:MAG: hypothetical protein KDA53_06045 [Hyphomonas sp.]|nr:hypothetical protein [Hyphomonas sp.]